MRIRNKEIKDEFFQRKYEGEKGIAVKLAEKHKVSKQRIYQILKEPDGEREEGRYFRLLREKNQKTWDKKFKARFEKMPNDRKKETIEMKTKLIRDMVEAGFNFSAIASFMKYGEGGHTTVSKLYSK